MCVGGKLVADKGRDVAAGTRCMSDVIHTYTYTHLNMGWQSGHCSPSQGSACHAATWQPTYSTLRTWDSVAFTRTLDDGSLVAPANLRFALWPSLSGNDEALTHIAVGGLAASAVDG